MAHCTKCGSPIAEAAAFCPSCGAGQGAPAAAPAGAAGGAPAVATQSGMSENVAGLLCYVVGWITGLVFFLIDKRPFVRYHAAQSIVTFGALNIVTIALGMVFGVGFFFGGMAGLGGFWMGFWILRLVDLVCFVLWIVCMVKAYQGERFRVPIAADLAEKIAGK